MRRKNCFLDKALKKVPNIIRSFLTFFVVVIGWVFFFSDSIGGAFTYLGNMFGIGCTGGAGGYYLSSFIVLLLVSALCALPLGHNFMMNLKKQKTKYYLPVRAGINVCLFLLCVAAMVSDTYTSFLYAAF